MQYVCICLHECATSVHGKTVGNRTRQYFLFVRDCSYCCVRERRYCAYLRWCACERERVRDYFSLHYQQGVHCCGTCSWCRGAKVCVCVCGYVGIPLRSLCQFKSVWQTATHWSLDLQRAQRKAHTVIYCLWFSSVRSNDLRLGTVRVNFNRFGSPRAVRERS